MKKNIVIMRQNGVQEVGITELPDNFFDVSLSEQIFKLKQELSQTDYKIIKCSEHNLVGMDLPYDIRTLHNERQAIRDKINELESGQWGD